MGKPNRRYSGEFKQKAVEALQKKASYKKAMRKFEISGHHIIQKWEHILLGRRTGRIVH